MLRTLKQFAVGLSVLGSVGLYSFAVAPSASAFTFNNGTIEIDANDVDQEFTVKFDGNVSETDVTGLTSEAIFKFLGFNSVGDVTEAAFEVTLSNTSSNGIASRTSALGFDVDKVLEGIGNPSGSGKTRVEGLFTNDRSGSFPNQFGDIDVCFTDGNSCQGGGSGGVTTGNSGQFKATLALSGDVQKFALNNFGVRYQSINGTELGTSGTGRGSIVWDNEPEEPREIPEPTTVTALLAVGLGAARYGKRKQQALVGNGVS